MVCMRSRTGRTSALTYLFRAAQIPKGMAKMRAVTVARVTRTSVSIALVHWPIEMMSRKVTAVPTASLQDFASQAMSTKTTTMSERGMARRTSTRASLTRVPALGDRGQEAVEVRLDRVDEDLDRCAQGILGRGVCTGIIRRRLLRPRWSHWPRRPARRSAPRPDRRWRHWRRWMPRPPGSATDGRQQRDARDDAGDSSVVVDDDDGGRVLRGVGEQLVDGGRVRHDRHLVNRGQRQGVGPFLDRPGDIVLPDIAEGRAVPVLHQQPRGLVLPQELVGGARAAVRAQDRVRGLRDRARRQDPGAVDVGHEPGDVVGGRVAQDLLGGADLLDAAVAHHRDPVPQPHGLVEVVGDEQDRLAELPCRSMSWSCISRRMSGSSAEKASSMSRMSVSAARARARPTRWRIPPESRRACSRPSPPGPPWTGPPRPGARARSAPFPGPPGRRRRSPPPSGAAGGRSSGRPWTRARGAARAASTSRRAPGPPRRGSCCRP